MATTGQIRKVTTYLFHQNGLWACHSHQGAQCGRLWCAPGELRRRPGYLLGHLVAVYHDHGVGDRAEIEKHEGRVSQLLGHRGEDRIWQEIVSRLVQSHPEARSDLRTMMPLWGASLGEFVDDLQVTPKKGGLELGKLCKLLEPALSYCREQVCSH